MYWCAREERSAAETRRKLIQLGLNSSDLEKAMEELMVGNYINEERFARAYAQGHVRIKGWGPMKVRAGLFARGVEGTMISRVLAEVEDADWNEALRRTLEQAARKGYLKKDYASQGKLFRFAAGRGFDAEIIRSHLDEQGLE